MGALIPDDEREPVPGSLAEGTWLNADRSIGPEDVRGRGAVLVRWRAGDVRSIARLLRVQAIGRQRRVPALAIHVPGHPFERRSDCVENAVLREQVEVPVRQDPGGRLARRLGLVLDGSIALVDDRARLGARLPPAEDARVGELLDALGVPSTGERARWDVRGLAPSPDELSYPQGLAADGDRLAVADTVHHRVLVGTRDGGVDQVVGVGRPGARDGPLERAELSHPRGLWLSGDRLVVADSGNGAVRVADLEAGRVSTVAPARRLGRVGRADAGTGPVPWDVAPDPLADDDDADGSVLVSLAGADALASVPLDGSRVRPVELPERALVQPTGLAADDASVYVADAGRGAIRRLDADGRPTTVPGSDLAGLGVPTALARDPAGRLLVADAYGPVWRVDPGEGAWSRLAEGPAGGAEVGRIEEPRALAAAGDEVVAAGARPRLCGLGPDGDDVRVIEPEVPWPAADVRLELDPVEVAPGGRLTVRLVARGAGGPEPDAGKPDVRGPLSLRRTHGATAEDGDLVLEVEGFVHASGPQTVAWTVGEQATEHRAAWRFPVLQRPGGDASIEVVLSTKWPGS